MGECNENKNKEVENMLVLVPYLEQIENSLEVAANEVACKQEGESRGLEVVADDVAWNH